MRFVDHGLVVVSLADPLDVGVLQLACRSGFLAISDWPALNRVCKTWGAVAAAATSWPRISLRFWAGLVVPALARPRLRLTTHLDLHNADWKSFVSLATLPSVTHIELTDSCVGTESRAALLSFPHMHSLTLRRSTVGLLFHLVPATRLARVVVDSCAIADVDLPRLRLSWLSSLTLIDCCNLGAEALQALRTRLSRTAITVQMSALACPTSPTTCEPPSPPLAPPARC